MHHFRGCVLQRIVRACVLAALACVVVAGCDGNGVAVAQSRPGSQASPWGPPYSNMPDIVPPNVRATSFSALTAAQLGPPIDPAKGYRVESLGTAVYMVSDGNYNAMFVVSDVGVILADAPPNLGPKLVSAIQEVAPGAQIVALIYSHSHIDHIGYAGEIVKSNPTMQIVAHEETRRLLAFAGDANRPLPTRTFDTQDTDYPLVVGNQSLQLRYPGANHDTGNIAIYHPGQKVLMFVDVVYPGWMMWRRLGLATNIPGLFAVLRNMNTQWDFDKLVTGHFQVGSKADVTAQLEFLTDLHNAITEGFGTAVWGQETPASSANNIWAVARSWTDRVVNHCVNKVTPKWGAHLAAYDVFIYEQCMALEQSIRVDGPSLR